MVGYESLIEVCEKERITDLPGDFIEVGAFVGGGTRKLALYAKRFGKKVFAIDIFDPFADITICDKGIIMANIYNSHLNRFGLKMFEAYWFNIGKFSNIITIPKDSKSVNSPDPKNFVLDLLMEIIHPDM